VGHTAKDCKTAWSAIPGHEETRTCNICNTKGHIARDCPQKGAGAQQRQPPTEYNTFKNTQVQQQVRAVNQNYPGNSNGDDNLEVQQLDIALGNQGITTELLQAVANRRMNRSNMLKLSRKETLNWYDCLIDPILVRRAKPNTHQEAFFKLPKVGKDQVEFSIENANTPGGHNPPWSCESLKGAEHVMKEIIVNTARLWIEKLDEQEPLSRVERSIVATRADEAADDFSCIIPIRNGNMVVTDACADTGSMVNGISLKMLWALTGRCNVVKQCLEKGHWLEERDSSRDIVAVSNQPVRVYGIIVLPVSIKVTRPVEMVFMIYEDPMAALIIGTPGLRRLGFKFQAPASGGINMIVEPMRYKREYGLLRDVLVAQVHRDLGDREFTGAMLCPDVTLDQSKISVVEPNQSMRIRMSRTTGLGYKYMPEEEAQEDEIDAEDDDEAISQDIFIRSVAKNSSAPIGLGDEEVKTEGSASANASMPIRHRNFAHSTPTENGGTAAAPSFAQMSVIKPLDETGTAEAKVDAEQTPKTTKSQQIPRRLEQAGVPKGQAAEGQPSLVDSKLNQILQAIAGFEARATRTENTVQEINNGVKAMETRINKLETGFRVPGNSTALSDQYATPPAGDRAALSAIQGLEVSELVDKVRSGDSLTDPEETKDLTELKAEVSAGEDVVAQL